MYCSHCGQAIGPDDNFCPYCRTPVRQRSAAQSPGSLSLTFVEEQQILAEAIVPTSEDCTMTFGRTQRNDVVVNPPSKTVSEQHGSIVVSGGRVFLIDNNSTNGLYYAGSRQKQIQVAQGDVITIGKPQRGARRTIVVVGSGEKHWRTFDLSPYATLSIGRTDNNDLCLPDPTVSSSHALMHPDAQGGWSITDQGSSNGTRVNGQFVRGTTPLNSGSVIMLGNAQLVYLGSCLLVMSERQGVEVVAEGLVRYRMNKGVQRITTDHVSVHIKRGQFVAIVGGSGCGKSTLLNELNGTEFADEGTVLLDGTDLVANYEMLKSSIGYVPQQDIVYDNLRLTEMLEYAAKLRMQPDTTPAERTKRVDEVISLLELNNVRENYIGKLSGGQKKRASIAVELLADPRLLFLDEPTSGLDPGIERKLMASLADMAHEGRTIILVTHTTLNLHLCDQVIFLGAGGKLCYASDPQGATSFFGVNDFVEVYPKIDENPDYWESRFAAKRQSEIATLSNTAASSEHTTEKRVPGFFSQFLTLSRRYAKLLLNDRSRLLLTLGQAPLLAFLIHIVAGAGVFDVCEDTKFCLFAISCAAFWVGIFNSIQEICKEVSVFRREYDGGIRLSSYIASKVLVLGVLCLVQTLLLVGVLILTMGLPKTPIFSAPLELVISTYLTVLSAMCLGLLVSALFQSPDRALAVAPLLIMPQILFSGIAFELNGITEKISYAINCRWAIEALGTTADLNDLDLAIYGEEITVPPEKRTLKNQTIHVPKTTTEVDLGAPMGRQTVDVPAEDKTFDELEVNVPEITKTVDAKMLEHEKDDMFEHTMGHLLSSWGILLAFSVVSIAGCLLLLWLSVRK